MQLVSESLASGQSAFVLSAIGTLRKLCNHPMLVQHDLNQGNGYITGVSSKKGDGLKQPNRRYYIFGAQTAITTATAVRDIVSVA